MATALRKTPRQQTVIGVPSHVHQRLKLIAQSLGMQLRHIPALLAESWEVLSNEQRSKAIQRFMSHRNAATAVAPNEE